MILADTAGGTDLLSLLASSGIAGVILVAAIMGYITFKPTVDAMLRDKEAQQATIDRLVVSYEDRAIPALTEAVGAMRAMSEAATELQRTLDQQAQALREALARLEKVQP